MTAYYNEIDPFAAAWLRELIKAGHIASGDVDERSIEDVHPSDLIGYTQCHFFAGIGGWSYALRLAGWPDDWPVWTGSCPCQPFSAAGKGAGTSDERHLWPAFKWLIDKCRPSVAFGEQVASKAGKIWFSGVRADLEEMGYTVGAADLCAAGVSAPHIRQRLYWVGESDSARWPPRDKAAAPAGQRRSFITAGWPAARMEHANGYHKHWWSGPLQVGWNCCAGTVERSGRKFNSKWRLEPGLSIVAHGVSGRVGQLRGFGNAIVPQLAAEFILAHEESKLMQEIMQ